MAVDGMRYPNIKVNYKYFEDTKVFKIHVIFVLYIRYRS